MTDNAPEYLKRMNAALALREIPDNVAALSQLQRAVELAPSDLSIRLLIGLVHEDLDQLGEAEASYRKALELLPESQEAQQSLGLILIRQEKYQEAIPLLKKLLNNDSANLSVSQSLADAYAQSDQYNKAIEVLEKSITLHPQNIDLKFQKVNLLEYMGDSEGAAEGLEQIAKDMPSAKVINRLGIQYRKLDDDEKAHQMFLSAVDLDDEFVPARVNLAQYYLEMDQVDKALQVVESGLARSPDSFPLLLTKADALSKTNGWQESLLLYDRLIDIAEQGNLKSLDIVLVGKVVAIINHQSLDEGFRITNNYLDQYTDLRLLPVIVSLILSGAGRNVDVIHLLSRLPESALITNTALGLKYYTALIATGRAVEALNFLKMFYEQTKDNTKQDNLLSAVEAEGVKLFQKFQVEEAKLLFEQVLMISSTRARSINNIGFIYISQRAWDRAMALINQAQEIGYYDPAISQANQGYIELNQSQLENAIASFRDGLAKSRDGDKALLHVAYPWQDGIANNEADNYPSRMVSITTSILSNLATCYYYMKEPERAMQTAQIAIEGDPGESTGYRVKGCIHFLRGQNDEARAMWLAALDKEISPGEKEVVNHWLTSLPDPVDPA